MRLLRYRDGGGEHLGVLQDDEVIDLAALAAARGKSVPADMLALIDGGEDAVRRVRDLLAGSRDQSAIRHRLDGVELLAPLDPPRGNVLALGRNYGEHAREQAQARSEEVGRPTVFTKAQTSITAPGAGIVVDASVTQQVDWEGELGVVVGRAGKNISRDAALDHVFGYTIINDLSARDIQYGWGGQFYKGKSLDGFCPVGPWIVTRDEIPDPQTLRLVTRVNGAIKQDGNTAGMIFPVDDIIAQLSLAMIIPAGTLIATGTPSGVGYARNPPEFLGDGDVVEVEIDRIGVLRNRIVLREG